jgi:hypothetical protein
VFLRRMVTPGRPPGCGPAGTWAGPARDGCHQRSHGVAEPRPSGAISGRQTPRANCCLDYSPHVSVPYRGAFGVLRQTPGRLSQARSPVSPSRRNTPVALGLLRPAVHQCHDPARLRRLVAAGATAEHQRKGEQLKSPRACYHDHLRFSPTNRSVTNSGISVIAGPRTGRAPIISPSPCDDACQYG